MITVVITDHFTARVRRVRSVEAGALIDSCEADLSTLDTPVTRTTRLTAVFAAPARTAVAITGHVITPRRILTRTPGPHTQTDTLVYTSPRHTLHCAQSEQEFSVDCVASPQNSARYQCQQHYQAQSQYKHSLTFRVRAILS